MGAGPTMLDLAYLDAGTGSLIYQWILAGLLGGVFATRMMWGRIGSFFTKSKRSNRRDA